MNQKGQSGLGILTALAEAPGLVIGIWVFCLIFIPFLSVIDFSTVPNGSTVQFICYLFPIAVAITSLLLLINKMRNDQR